MMVSKWVLLCPYPTIISKNAPPLPFEGILIIFSYALRRYPYLSFKNSVPPPFARLSQKKMPSVPSPPCSSQKHVPPIAPLFPPLILHLKYYNNYFSLFPPIVLPCPICYTFRFYPQNVFIATSMVNGQTPQIFPGSPKFCSLQTNLLDTPYVCLILTLQPFHTPFFFPQVDLRFANPSLSWGSWDSNCPFVEQLQPKPLPISLPPTCFKTLFGFFC